MRFERDLGRYCFSEEVECSIRVECKIQTDEDAFQSVSNYANCWRNDEASMYALTCQLTLEEYPAV